MTTLERVAGVLCATAVMAAGLSACSGSTSDPGTNPTTQAHAASSQATTPAVRWWSTPEDAVGSRIDTSSPSAQAAKLTASRGSYCLVLKQTIRAGKSVLPGATAQDPAVLASVRAFIAETRALAPKAVAADWTVLGAVFVKIAAAKGDLGSVKVDQSAVQRAAQSVAADAKSNCHLDLSKATTTK